MARWEYTVTSFPTDEGPVVDRGVFAISWSLT